MQQNCFFFSLCTKHSTKADNLALLSTTVVVRLLASNSCQALCRVAATIGILVLMTILDLDECRRDTERSTNLLKDDFENDECKEIVT